MRLRVKKYHVTHFLLFIFALGVQAGFLLSFVESDNRFRQRLRSMEETATWSP